MAADGRWHPLIDGCPPRWATEWGQDRFGVFVGFSVGDVEQRMRWTPAGTFMMGSPEQEVGPLQNERPQHLVTISQGFWLGDAPVTQALWTAVMGDNPSAAKGDDRPVENVSWDDGQRLCAALEDHVPGLGARLPTEAQWEYACRAGTTQATYAGDLEDDRRAAVLDDIAWYSANAEGTTHPVKHKRPNDWGLYDMLGNVWEWCLDGQRLYASSPQRDPLGPMQTGAYRVRRGGSWNNNAGGVRAAYRNANFPDVRYVSLGLRLVRDQEGPAAGAAGQPAKRRT
ncbi:MAG: formylglycine-generating enzyme family protein [Deltaproteobacteria bacterium]|nr:formylglycine-generating enzyme family protein [Deltaproteobacteria bacterium]